MSHTLKFLRNKKHKKICISLLQCYRISKIHTLNTVAWNGEYGCCCCCCCCFCFFGGGRGELQLWYAVCSTTLSLSTAQFVAAKTHYPYLGDTTCPYYCTYLIVYCMYVLVCKPVYFLQQCDLIFIQSLELFKSFTVCEILQTRAYSTHI